MKTILAECFMLFPWKMLCCMYFIDFVSILRLGVTEEGPRPYFLMEINSYSLLTSS